jgi:DNA-binding winged helix-turn-helix (wHTH) protein
MVTNTTLPASGHPWVYLCDDIVVEPRAHRLERGGQPVLVEPKAYAVLVALLEHAGTMLEKNALLDSAWGHRNVTPGVLSRVISQLRHALGDSSRHPRYVATVNCLGYRFIGVVQRRDAPATPFAEPAVDTRATAFTDRRSAERRQSTERRTRSRCTSQ